MSIIRKELPLFISSVIGVIIIFNYFFKEPMTDTFVKTYLGWVTILASVGFIVAYSSAIIMNISRLLKRAKGQWIYSVIFLMTIFTWLIIGFTIGTGSYQWKLLVSHIYTPVSTTMYSMIAFYVLSATFRVFRARDFKSLFFPLAMLVLIMSNAPIGDSIWSGFGTIGRWFFDVPNIAAQRAIVITAGLGAVTLLIRIILRKERNM